MIPTEVTLIESKSDNKPAVHYIPFVERNRRMPRHMDVERHDNKNFKHNWKDNVHLLEKYAGYREQFVVMLTEVQYM